MSPRTPKPADKATLAVPSPGVPKMKHLGGSDYDLLNGVLVAQVMNSLWLAPYSDEERENLKRAASISLAGIAPKDEIEGMLAAQMVAAHSAAMECYRRAMLPDQPREGREQNLNFASKLSRTFTLQMEALQKHRGKGQQKVTVEHVHVHAGGQAIVGTVERPQGGGGKKTEEQPHAKHQRSKRLGHAPAQEMPGANPARLSLPVPRDA